MAFNTIHYSDGLKDINTTSLIKGIVLNLIIRIFNVEITPMKFLRLFLLIFSFTIGKLSFSQPISFKNLEKDKKVEVYIGRKFFTAFIYPDNMEKQTLYPIVNAKGKFITRGYPLDPRPFERSDHPHQVGLWFNFGDVNGLDFWNNSFAIKPADKPKYGSIRFNKIESINPKNGTLIVSANWVDVNNTILLSELTSFTFYGKGNLRTIVRETQLTAKQEVSFTENKEGLIGLRVDRSFEEPATVAETFLDAQGIETKVPVLNNEGVNGVYRNLEGAYGATVWGKRSNWVALRATKENEVITLALLDHSKNTNYPAWSHARGYGLFAMNNLGGRNFDKNAEAVKLNLQAGQTVVFKHKLVIGDDLSDESINKIAMDFNK